MYDPELCEVFASKNLGSLYRDDYDGLPYDDVPVDAAAAVAAGTAK
jgi:hypothetical protein